MARRPPAEVEVTPDLLRRLLREQHPDLADEPLVPVSPGWDNTLVRVGDGLLARLPRRRAAAELVGHEQAWLPLLARRLPVPVPAPVRTGAPSAGYPWRWSLVRWFAGHPAAADRRVDRRAWAEPLADVLHALHVPAPAGAPANPWRGVPLATRDASVRAWLGSVPPARRPAVRSAWERALAAPAWPGPPLWVHGDLHPWNLLVEGARLAAVLDFGDLHAGDPAADLATAWLTFDTTGRERMRARLSSRPGAIADRATWTRATGWAVVVALALLEHSEDDEAAGEAALRTLDEVARTA